MKARCGGKWALSGTEGPSWRKAGLEHDGPLVKSPESFRAQASGPLPCTQLG